MTSTFQLAMTMTKTRNAAGTRHMRTKAGKGMGRRRALERAEAEEGGELEEHAEAIEEVGGGDDVVEAHEGDAEDDEAGEEDADPGGVEEGGAAGEEAREEAQVRHAHQLERAAAQLSLVEPDRRQHRPGLDPVLEPPPRDPPCPRVRFRFYKERRRELHRLAQTRNALALT
ncbi:hypothetical protein ACMD2_22825 [Ananas comosus]|uniref:Uncharacterized protein n=1 Tax=Ananas comosus TaxID=4615 RepID=A0A199UZ91_ANACO|nr:hypothetical protein ACMD2_22825 [Ananas comosus]